jgi:hypothetical protein
MNSNRDTSVPMELGVVDAAEEESWEVDVSSPSQTDSVDHEEIPFDPTLSTEDDLTSVGYTSAEDRDQQVNFVTRERRPSDRPWRSNRSGEYNRGRVSNSSGVVKQQAAQKNTCWNCGKVGHFLLDCPYQKVNSTESFSSSTSSKPPTSKKF